MAALAVLVVGIGVADIVRIAHQQGPVPEAWALAQSSMPPHRDAPEIEDERAWLREREGPAPETQAAPEGADLP